MGVGPAHSASLSLLPVLTWFLLCNLVIGFQSSGDSQVWLFYNLVIILIWSWEEVSTVITYSQVYNIFDLALNDLLSHGDF